MSAYLNKAAKESWKAVHDLVDGPLRANVTQSLGDERYVDAWLERMLQNGHDTMAEDDLPDAMPVRRIGLHAK